MVRTHTTLASTQCVSREQHRRGARPHGKPISSQQARMCHPHPNMEKNILFSGKASREPHHHLLSPDLPTGTLSFSRPLEPAALTIDTTHPFQRRPLCGRPTRVTARAADVALSSSASRVLHLHTVTLVGCTGGGSWLLVPNSLCSAEYCPSTCSLPLKTRVHAAVKSLRHTNAHTVKAQAANVVSDTACMH